VNEGQLNVFLNFKLDGSCLFWLILVIHFVPLGKVLTSQPNSLPH